ncbi:uncharacterized protein N7443_009951 [Penicillium atrosanguineum]|uniref:Uncharacterized protein n=1 Tax=Penicillium atrosanguineum TaxID=1132637 RepID=A0A9W9U1A6_9EURO|nr:uncharacterized protein N7443_009951 [Penicillium atrosanguineum]KAJ5137760.1 hypothetical protein N7526_003993 [Penicillium atrosanguineum]KAJ5289698.1 hypothetical protein N7443_009951 [Penicillium atrosanguineum]KAJ5307518.1 hypothetical protein N7476_008174 [Penicillium atrosanguineum]
MPSPSKPTISKSGTRKKIVPHVPNSSLPKTAAPTTSNTVKKDDLSNTIPIKENSPSTPSRAPSTAPQSSAPRSTIGTYSIPNSLSLFFFEDASTQASPLDTVQLQLQEADSKGPPISSPAIWSEDAREDYDSELDPGEDEEMEAFEHHLVAHRSTSESGLAETVRHVNAFLDSTKDKHSIEIPTVRLRDHSNFHEWKIAVELRLRMHQVWFLFRGLDDGDKITPVPNDHKLSLWYERMVDVASAIIYSSVSSDIRKQPCFLGSMCRRDLEDMMIHLICHYAQDPDDVSDSDSDDISGSDLD